MKLTILTSHRASLVAMAFLAVALVLNTSATPAQTDSKSAGMRLPVLNWTPRSDWIDVKSAGARGDGTTDDTDAIQKVLDRLSDKNKPAAGQARALVVYFPPGRYRITRTLTISESTDGWLVGHGRETTILWDGEPGGRMYWSNGCRFVCYEGLTWDGQGKAGTLIGHQSQSYYETWVRYMHCAFVNSRQYGVVVGQGEFKNPSAEISFLNCKFDHCGEGISLLAPNDYDNLIDACEFDHCGIGIHGNRGNWQVRGCRFEGSTVADVKQDDISHAAAIRLCVSTGSRRFLETCHNANPMPMQIQGCRIDGWTATDGAILLGHPGPLTIFDCVFSHPPGKGPAIVLTGANEIPQALVESSNATPAGMPLLEAGNKASITKIPAGQRAPVLPDAGQRFFSEHARIPTQVFDAVRDFGAKKDGKTDDTLAIQHCIDAARKAGKDAIAYLPGGSYRISQTLNVTGADYFFGGIGTATRLVWAGADTGGVAIHVDTPQRIVLENFAFGQRDDRYSRIVQTGNGASSIYYDQIETNHWNEYPPEGLLCENLPAGAQVRLGLFNGNLRLHDCGEADIFAFSHYGPATLDGWERPKTGFTGFMFHNAALSQPIAPLYALTVKDNQNLVVADYYMEQSARYLLCEGGKRKGAGYVTLGASKISTKNAEAVTVHDYEGRIWISGGDAQCESDLLKPLHFKQEGTRPLWFILTGNSWCEYEPIPDFDPAGHFVRLGNVLRGQRRGPLSDIAPAGAMPEAAAALDDLRHLGAVYLREFGERRP